LLNITDSRFQDELLQKAKRAQKIPDDYQIPDEFKNNFPERIEKILTPFRQKGLFPPFPFGTDFTKEELVLGKALRWLKERMADGLGRKASSIGRAMTVRSVPEKVKPYLQRMQLENPTTAKEHMMQKLIVYALIASGAKL
jgi:hypothetical protein